MQLTDGYRSSRRYTLFFSLLSIFWAAALFEIESISLSTLATATVTSTSIHVMLAIVSIYAIVRSTLEYMMQSEDVRNWGLARIDYKISLYTFRLSLLVLAAASISRSIKMVAYIAFASILSVAFFFFLVFVLTMIVMLVITSFRKKPYSAAGAAMASFAYAVLISIIIYTVLIFTIWFSPYLPIDFINLKGYEITFSQISIFSTALLLTLISFIFDEKFFKLVFSIKPLYIVETYKDSEGNTIYREKLNRDHPEYNERRQTQMDFVFRKVED